MHPTLPPTPSDSCILLHALHTDDASPIIVIRAMAEAQVNDPNLIHLHSDSSLQLQQVPLAHSDGASIVCDISTGVPRPYVPESFQRPIISLALTPWYSSHTAFGNKALCVATHKLYCLQVGTIMSSVSKVKSVPPHHFSPCHIRYPRCSF